MMQDSSPSQGDAAPAAIVRGNGAASQGPGTALPSDPAPANAGEHAAHGNGTTAPVGAAPARLAFSAWQLVGALLIAGASDLIGGSIDATVAGVPATIPLDILTALALWAILGRPVLLLVALIAEALPGVGVLPLWTAVVIAIAMTGGIPGRIPR